MFPPLYNHFLPHFPHPSPFAPHPPPFQHPQQFVPHQPQVPPNHHFPLSQQNFSFPSQHVDQIQPQHFSANPAHQPPFIPSPYPQPHSVTHQQHDSFQPQFHSNRPFQQQQFNHDQQQFYELLQQQQQQQFHPDFEQQPPVEEDFVNSPSRHSASLMYPNSMDFQADSFAAKLYDDDVDEDHEESLFLAKLERKCAKLLKRHEYTATIALMEESVHSRKVLYGSKAVEAMKAEEKLGLLYNTVAMSYMQKEDYRAALKLLRKAITLSADIPEYITVRIQTLNNIACLYRRIDRPRAALMLLREALTLLQLHHSTLSSSHHLAVRPITHLNMCAILSSLGAHEEAVEHARSAVMYCQKQFLNESLEKRSDKTEESKEDEEMSKQRLTEQIVILGISYHNLGVEEECLKHYTASIEWYQKALKLAAEHIGVDATLTRTFQDSLQAAHRHFDDLLHARNTEATLTTTQPDKPFSNDRPFIHRGKVVKPPSVIVSEKSIEREEKEQPLEETIKLSIPISIPAGPAVSLHSIAPPVKTKPKSRPSSAKLIASKPSFSSSFASYQPRSISRRRLCELSQPKPILVPQAKTTGGKPDWQA